MDDYYKKYPSSSRDRHIRHQATGMVSGGGHHSLGMGQVYAGSPVSINPNSNRSGRSLIPSDSPLMGTPTSLDYSHVGNNNGTAIGDGHHDYGSSASSATMMMDHRSIYGGPPVSSAQPPPMDIPMNMKISTGNQNYYDSRIGDAHASATTTAIPPSSASTTSRTLEKYFTQDELKRFNEFNRFLVMSSPEQQKKFYASLTSVEYKRFNDYLDMESQAKSVPAPPPLPQIPSTPSINQGHQPASQSLGDPYLNQTQQPKPSYTIQSSYSYDTSYYDDGNNENMANSTLNNHYHRNTHKFTQSPSQVTSEYYGRSSAVDNSGDCYQPPLPQIHNDSYNQEYNDHRYHDGYEENQTYGSTYSSTYGTSYRQRDISADRHRNSTRNSIKSRSRSRTPNRFRKSSSSNHRNSSLSERSAIRKSGGRDDHDRFKHSRSSDSRAKKPTTSSSTPKESQNKHRTSSTNSSSSKTHSKDNDVKILEERIKELEKRLDNNRTKSHASSSDRSSSLKRNRSQDSSATKSTSSKSGTATKTPSSSEASKKKPIITETKKPTTNTETTTVSKSKETDKKSSISDGSKQPISSTTDEKSQKTVSNSSVNSASKSDSKTHEMKNYKIPKKSDTQNAAVTPKKKRHSKCCTKSNDSPSKSSKSESTKKHSDQSPIKSRTSPSRVSTSSRSHQVSSRRREPSPVSVINLYGSHRLTQKDFDDTFTHFHWCNLCHLFFKTESMYLKHLHTDRHFSKLGSSDFQIIRKAEERINANETSVQSDFNPLKHSSSTSSTVSNISSQSVDCDKEQFLGTEFFYPLISFYCDLCSKFLPTNQQGQDHLRSERHLVLYQKYMKKNVDFYNKFNEKRMEQFKKSPYVRQFIHEQFRQRLLEQKNKGKPCTDSQSSQTVSNNISSEKVPTEIKKLMDSILDRVVVDFFTKKNKATQPSGTSIKPVVQAKKSSEDKITVEKVAGNKRPADDKTLKENSQMKKIKENPETVVASTTIINSNDNDTGTQPELPEMKNKGVSKMKNNNVGQVVQTETETKSDTKEIQTKNKSKKSVTEKNDKNGDDLNAIEKTLEMDNVDQTPPIFAGYRQRRAAAAAAASIIAQQSHQTRSKPIKKPMNAKNEPLNNADNKVKNTKKKKKVIIIEDDDTEEEEMETIEQLDAPFDDDNDEDEDDDDDDEEGFDVIDEMDDA
ncbi:uncharacterized protein LOC113791673 [Dermatophagoides pteronyssinus]|uniref:uncharacterized protein LOC113791673 n=1 Tax=Dermatophagoides pteronyssinus TaxID=6956 RepID=UPI003F67C690